jgi:hypothetical protein
MMWFHRHRWRIVSASCDMLMHWIGGRYTLVTCAVGRCECGKLKQFELAGKHSLESLQGEATEVDRVLKSLER